MNGSQGSKQKESMELAGWFYPTQRTLLYLQIRLLSNQSFWWIIFNILKCWNLKKKRAEEKAKESRKTKNKLYEDYPWADLCEDATKLKKLRFPELNKYLNHHGLKQHLKSSKSEKVKVIVRHCLQQTSPFGAGRPTLRNARTLTQNDNGASTESSETDERDNDEYDSDGTDSRGDDSSDVILALSCDSDEEDANERPNATRSGRAITKRSEIDFSFF